MKSIISIRTFFAPQPCLLSRVSNPEPAGMLATDSARDGELNLWNSAGFDPGQ